MLRAEPDLLVVQAAIVSAEHVPRTVEPLNLKAFIRHYELPCWWAGARRTTSALHLMRTGAAGVLVGAGSGAAGVTREVLGVGVPLATAALADARAARMRHLDETGVCCHVIADGITTGGDIARAVACGGAVMTGAVRGGHRGAGSGLALEHAGSAPHPAPGGGVRRRPGGRSSRSCTGRRTTPRAWSTSPGRCGGPWRCAASRR